MQEASNDYHVKISAEVQERALEGLQIHTIVFTWQSVGGGNEISRRCLVSRGLR
jgi:hypothetical protein